MLFQCLYLNSEIVFGVYRTQIAVCFRPQIVDLMDIPLAYQPQDATRLKVKAVGDIMNMVDDENAQTHGNLTYVIRKDGKTYLILMKDLSALRLKLVL